MMSKALTMKAPVASGTVTPCVTANTAAPGVDQAVNTGCRYQRLNTKLVPPMPKPRAHIQDAVCASLAPKACAAAKTMTAELVNPTSTATKPATTVDRDASLSHFFNMGVFSQKPCTWHEDFLSSCASPSGAAFCG
jgi:hypothetical protein